MKNKILEAIKDRESYYVKSTEKVISSFILEVKEALEHSLFKGSTVELFINDVSILPQNFRFCRLEGRVATYTIGDKITTKDGGSVDIGLENFWDFAEFFTLVIPFSLLDEPEVEKLTEYFLAVKKNDGKMLDMSDNKSQRNAETKEFVGMDKELDHVQKFILKTLKNSSVH